MSGAPARTSFPWIAPSPCCPPPLQAVDKAEEKKRMAMMMGAMVESEEDKVCKQTNPTSTYTSLGVLHGLA